MAKAAKEKDKDAGGKSALDAAFKAFQAGDAVGARRAARAVIASPSADDEAAVKRVAKALLGDDAGEVHAETLAQDLIRRTSFVPRPYLWALGGLLAYAMLLTMALVRYG